VKPGYVREKWFELFFSRTDAGESGDSAARDTVDLCLPAR
jgi:hypothetical protein